MRLVTLSHETVAPPPNPATLPVHLRGIPMPQERIKTPTPLLAVGTAVVLGENANCTGRLLLLDVEMAPETAPEAGEADGAEAASADGAAAKAVGGGTRRFKVAVEHEERGPVLSLGAMQARPLSSSVLAPPPPPHPPLALPSLHPPSALPSSSSLDPPLPTLPRPSPPLQGLILCGVGAKLVTCVCHEDAPDTALHGLPQPSTAFDGIRWPVKGAAPPPPHSQLPSPPRPPIHRYVYREDALVVFAFYIAGFGVSALSTLRNYVFAGDVHQGAQLLSWKPERQVRDAFGCLLIPSDSSSSPTPGCRPRTRAVARARLQAQPHDLRVRVRVPAARGHAALATRRGGRRRPRRRAAAAQLLAAGARGLRLIDDDDD